LKTPMRPSADATPGRRSMGTIAVLASSERLFMTLCSFVQDRGVRSRHFSHGAMI
jgi:hypothetical protein